MCECNAACAGGKKSVNGTPVHATNIADDDYVALFESGAYQAAYDSASLEAGSMRSVRRSEAALIAGLSAQALSKDADAIRWLSPLKDDADGQIAGRSCAALGLIAQQRGEHDSAAQYLSRAGRKLQGDDAARAWMYASDSYRALGRANEASDALAKAKDMVRNDDALGALIADRAAGGTPRPVAGPVFGAPRARPQATMRTGPTNFTVQAGAYASLSTAQRTSQQIARKGHASRIVQIGKSGKTLYAVRVGSFSSKSAAENVRKTVGSGAIVTAAVGE